MANQQVFVLGSDGNLWLEEGPFGKQIPPFRIPVDGNVDLYASFSAFSAEEALVCGSDGNLWLEEGSFGTVPLPSTSYPPGPRSRTQIDGSVAAYWALDPGNIFVLGQDGNLWYEFGFGTTIPAVPPPRNQVDGNVQEFQVMGPQEVFVLGTDGNLWHEFGPFDMVPLPACKGGTTSGCRSQVDGNVHTFWAVDSNNVYVIGKDGNLWLESGPFGSKVPPPRVQVDGNALGVWGVDAEEAFVLGSDLNLWQVNAPFGKVPLPDCSQTSGFGKGFGCRTLVHSNVAAFGYFPDAGGVYVIDGNLDLWQVGPPPVKIDGNVIDFQPLGPEQMLMRRADRGARRGTTRPARVGGLNRAGRLLKRA